MKTTDYLKTKQQLEDFLSRHKLQEAIEILQALDFEGIPAKWRADFAQLARRAHMYKDAVKILQDKVHSVGEPETKDLLEYASCLRKLGMMQQCLNLLERLPDHKEKLLHQAYCHVHSWDYEKAGPVLLEYLQQPQLNEREVLVAKLNLSACYIFLNQHDKAEHIIDGIIDLCEEKYYQFFLNCLEMRGQILVAQYQLKKAWDLLNHAELLANHQPGNTTLFIEKWKLIAQARQNPDAFAPELLANFKKKIRSQGHWETLRDVDFQFSDILGDKNLLNYVYFGTPFDSFKKRLALKNGHQLSPHFLWSGSNASAAGARDPNTPITSHLDPLDSNVSIVPFGLIQHRLLLVLLSDFYRPWSVARLFDSLFPNDIYDVESSPKRIYALIKKIQDSITELNLPFELASTIHGYRLRVKPGGAISIYDKMNFSSHEEILFYALKQKYHLKEFTPRELSEVLEISSHKAYRWINELKKLELVTQSDSGYKLKAS